MNRWTAFYTGVLLAAMLLAVLAAASHHPNILMFANVLAVGAFALAGRAYDVHISRKDKN